MDQVVLSKLQKYCAYQERCHQEVRSKLIKLQVYGDDLEEIIAELISTGFLNESRFAESFVRGKFRNNDWGKIKIALELRSRKISEFDIRKGLEQLDDDAYRERLTHLIAKKEPTVRARNAFEKKQKLRAFAQRKGFESWLVSDILRDLELS